MALSFRSESVIEFGSDIHFFAGLDKVPHVLKELGIMLYADVPDAVATKYLELSAPKKKRVVRCVEQDGD